METIAETFRYLLSESLTAASLRSTLAESARAVTGGSEFSGEQKEAVLHFPRDEAAVRGKKERKRGGRNRAASEGWLYQKRRGCAWPRSFTARSVHQTAA